MWDERYDREDYLFGTQPNAFLTREVHRLKPGARALAVADGEGRNAVYLAERGLRVCAMDSSPVALRKARALAGERGVQVDFTRADLADWDWTPAAFDVVVAIFIQFANPKFRARIFDGIERTLAPGGLLLLHGYTPRQIMFGTGGPPHPENLYERTMLAQRFAHWDILRLEDYEAVIEEGTGHSGRSALVDLVARRPPAG